MTWPDDFVNRVVQCDCRDALRELPDGCAALAVVDGPYNMRKADWDKFATWQDFRAFYRPLWGQLSRVLRDNCSLYVFGTFESLAALKQDLDELGGGWAYRQACTWDKGMEAIAGRTSDTIRMHPNRTEHCLFYARERVDISALAWDGVTREDNTIRAYLNAERERAGVTIAECEVAFGPSVRHFFGQSQWRIPTREYYMALRAFFNQRGSSTGAYLQRDRGELEADALPLRREYKDLRREYEDLRREYEDLRYTFNPQKGVTDVWDVPICAGAERVKLNGQTAHVAQKPLAIMRRIVAASSNEGDLVIVPFSGVGSAEVACVELSRSFSGFEIDPGYCAIAERRIAQARREFQPRLIDAPRSAPVTGDLFVEGDGENGG